MPNPESPGPEFLKGKYGDDPEFQDAIERSSKKARRLNGEPETEDSGEQITAYLERLLRIARYRTPAGAKTREGRNSPEGPDPEHGLRQLKRILHEKHVIKPDEIPDDYIKEVLLGNFAEQSGYERHDLRNPVVRDQVVEQFAQRTGRDLESLEISREQREEVERQTVEDQQASLDTWLDYLASPEADNYPPEFRYWAMAEVLQCGAQDQDRKRYKERRPDTTAQFPELNQQALALVLDEVTRKLAGRSSQLKENLQPSDWQAFRSRLKTENFSSLYGWAIDHVNRLRLPAEKLANTKGEWEVFTKEDGAKAVTEKIHGYNTGWCIAGEGTAASYLERSKILVFFSEDEGGEKKIPRAAIVTDGQQITEVRGIMSTKETKQHLDDYIIPTVETQLKTMPGGESWLDTMADQRHLANIHLRHLKGTFTLKDYDDPDQFRRDLAFLYELDRPIKYSGYGQDPRIAELRATRNPNEDAPIVFGCTKEQISHTPDAIGPDTKAYIGPLESGIFQKISEHTIEYVYTSFPEGKIRRYQIEVGGKSGQEYLQELEQQDDKYYLSDWAKDIMVKTGRADFEQNRRQEPAKTQLVRITVEGLGFPEGATTNEIYAKAKELGLALNSPDVGPALRLQTDDPDYMVIAMEQIVDRYGSPYVFILFSSVGQLLLDASYAPSDFGWHRVRKFVVQQVEA